MYIHKSSVATGHDKNCTYLKHLPKSRAFINIPILCDERYFFWSKIYCRRYGETKDRDHHRIMRLQILRLSIACYKQLLINPCMIPYYQILTSKHQCWMQIRIILINFHDYHIHQHWTVVKSHHLFVRFMLKTWAGKPPIKVSKHSSLSDNLRWLNPLSLVFGVQNKGKLGKSSKIVMLKWENVLFILRYAAEINPVKPRIVSVKQRTMMLFSNKQDFV